MEKSDNDKDLEFKADNRFIKIFGISASIGYVIFFCLNYLLFIWGLDFLFLLITTVMASLVLVLIFIIIIFIYPRIRAEIIIKLDKIEIFINKRLYIQYYVSDLNKIEAVIEKYLYGRGYATDKRGNYISKQVMNVTNLKFIGFTESKSFRLWCFFPQWTEKKIIRAIRQFCKVNNKEFNIIESSDKPFNIGERDKIRSKIKSDIEKTLEE